MHSVSSTVGDVVCDMSVQWEVLTVVTKSITEQFSIVSNVVHADVVVVFLNDRQACPVFEKVESAILCPIPRAFGLFQVLAPRHRR